MKHNRTSSFQHGVTMIEVLVAIVVLSFGLLAMLGLLLNGLRMTSTSNYRTIAAQQLVAMADMMNANPDLIGAYASPVANNGTYCFGANCTGTQVATADYDIWQSNVANSLPNGSGIVCLVNSAVPTNFQNFVCGTTGRPSVKICWNENARVAISGGGASGFGASTDTCLTAQL